MTIHAPIRPPVSWPTRSATSKLGSTGTELVVSLVDDYAMVVDLQGDLPSVVPNGAFVKLWDGSSNLIGTGYAKWGTGSSSVGPEQAPDPTMDIACGGAGWACDTGWTISGGVAAKVTTAIDSWFYVNTTLPQGELWRIVTNISSYTAGTFAFDLDCGCPDQALTSAGEHTQYHTIHGSAAYGGLKGSPGAIGDVTSFSAKNVTSFGTQALNIYSNASLTTRGWLSTGNGAPNSANSLEYSTP